MPILVLLVAVAVFFVVRVVRRRSDVERPQHGPVGWCADTRWRALAPLARADSRRLLRHPAFLVGVVLTPLMMVAATGPEDQWRVISPMTALALVPLGWFTIVAVNLLALRPARTGTAELFATLPAPQPVRSAGLLATAWVAATSAALLAVGWTALALTRDDLTGSPQWSEIAAGVLVVAGSVMVGVAVARWLPFAALGVAAAVAVSILQARFLDVTTWPWDRPQADPLRFLGFLAEPASAGDTVLEVRPAGWHLVYLAALVAFMGIVALARDGVPRRLAAALVAALGVVTVAGWAQTRPLSETRVARMVSYLTDPTAHQVCDQRGPVRYCAYPSSAHLVDEWQARVDGVLALVPESVVRRSLEVIQRVPITIGNADCGAQPYLDALPPAVAARLTAQAVWSDDGMVHPDLGRGSFPCSSREIHEFFTAVQIGAWVAGLPPSPHHDDERCSADGQARAVLALWLGAAATPDGADLLRDLTAEASSPTASQISFDGWDNPPMWGVEYTTADAALAIALLDQPAADIANALDDQWSHWTAPDTSSASLAAHLGLAAPPATSGSATCP